MVKALEDIIAKSSSIVFFGGAGVSTESGIPDFRSVDGLYHQKYDYPPETILSHTFWEENPEEFYRFYRDKLIVKGAKPNAAHLRLAKLEQQGKLRAVVTQNIDGLHQAAGSSGRLSWSCWPGMAGQTSNAAGITAATTAASLPTGQNN